MSKSRNLLKSITHSLGNGAYKRKLRKKPELFFTLRQICENVGLNLENLDDVVRINLDKTVSYVCRYGDRFTKDCICVQLYDDSDNIMKKAVSEGALVCVTDHKIEGLPCIIVDNPYVTYADMCSVIRDTAQIKSTVVVGSIGKTTTKKMVASVYKQAFNTHCDSGNDNILDSIGSICQHIPEKSEQLVAEISEDTPGLIEQMSKIVKPEIAIITTIDKSHIEFYGSEENIFNEFRSVTKHMREDGICIMSMDEENAKNLIDDRKVIYVSVKDENADFFAININVDTNGLNFDVVEKATQKKYAVKLYNSYAIHNVTAALIAFTAGVVNGMDYNKIVKGLAAYRATGIRQNIYKSGSHVVYADCYNAVAKSVRSAVNAACEIPIKGKRIAVLGDIAEAGEYTESTHLEIANIVNDSNFDVLLTFGKELRKAILKTKMRDDLKISLYDTQKELNKALKMQLKKGDLVLFKASHRANLEASIAKVFTLSYLFQSIKYYTPRILWHFKVILN